MVLIAIVNGKFRQYF